MKVAFDSGACVFRKDTSASPQLDLAAAMLKEYSVAYAYTTVDAATDGDAYFHFGSDDGAKVYLNGVLIHHVYANRGCREHSDVFAGHLKKGSNALLVKVDQGNGGWGLVLQILDRTAHAAWVKSAIAGEIGITMSQSGGNGQRLDLRPAPRIATLGVLDSVAVQWQVTGPKGDTVGRASSTFAAPAAVEITKAPGYYAVHLSARTPAFSQTAMCLVGADRGKAIDAIAAKASAWLAKPSNAAYEGMVAYRLAQLQNARKDSVVTSDCVAAAAALEQLLDGAAQNTLGSMRGEFEWAYRSNVDGTGQPFRIGVPDSYDTGKVWPLDIYLHGMGGTHFPPAVGERVAHPQPYFSLNVLGRSKAGQYMKLSEVDVLEAIAYVRAHWRIDSLRIHLTGGSMGGGGTFKMAVRHPSLFASAGPECGFGAELPMENLLHVPVYSMHSIDDWTVAVSQSRLPVRALAAMGGAAIQDEQNGYGHGIGNCKDCMARRDAWQERQVRPATVSEIRYTAFDELARGAYWASVLEWGPVAAPAKFHLRASGGELYVVTDNVGILALSLKASPVDRGRGLTIVYRGRIDTALAAPLPDSLYLTAKQGGLRVSAKGPAVPEVRRHFPGGLPALYHGEPLLIVWGTTGDGRADSLLKAQAEMARYAVRPSWVAEPRSATFETMLTGAIPAKADADVTPADIAGCNLILLGTAAQNSVVAKIAGKLPVRVEAGKVVTSDKLSWPFAGRALGLLYHNPLAPKRLVYWLAVDKLDKQESGLSALRPQGWALGAQDFYLVRDTDGALVSQRSFRPDWSWEEGYAKSPLLPTELCRGGALGEFAAEALQQQAGCDFAIRVWPAADTSEIAVAGESRLMDVFDRWMPPAIVFALRGDSLLAHTRGPSPKLAVVPAVDSTKVRKDRWYRVACADSWMLGDYTATARSTPDSIWYAGCSQSDAFRERAKMRGW
jgi:poly(3-hydroxybutyrate) depolymerase